jgi:hypothetical protein
MTIDPALAELRGQVSVLHEGLKRIADRVDAVYNARQSDRQRDADERKASRRFTLTTTITAALFVFTSLGLILNSVLG